MGQFGCNLAAGISTLRLHDAAFAAASLNEMDPHMKKTMVALCLTSVLALAAHAAEAAKEKKAETHHTALTEEQKTTIKEITAKYDTNKDGKLDKAERAKVSEADMAKLKSAQHLPAK